MAPMEWLVPWLNRSSLTPVTFVLFRSMPALAVTRPAKVGASITLRVSPVRARLVLTARFVSLLMSIELPRRDTLALRRASLRVPVAILLALRLVRLAPLPMKLLAVTEPVKVGASVTLRVTVSVAETTESMLLPPAIFIMSESPRTWVVPVSPARLRLAMPTPSPAQLPLLRQIVPL